MLWRWGVLLELLSWPSHTYEMSNHCIQVFSLLHHVVVGSHHEVNFGCT